MSKDKDKVIFALLQDERQVRKGFEMLVQQYSQLLYWKIRHLVTNHDDANDVLQNVFIKVWNNLGQFQGHSSIGTWLYRIAINESLDFLRHKKTSFIVSADEDINIVNQLLADEYFDGDETAAQLQAAIALLPEVQRTVFTLRYYDEMKYSEMSRILATSEGALKASYHLAVKKISDYFHRND